ncbi:hypothetical protein IQ277_07455 [Nostocales cyanobacterium LEGE 12452]|nr:hypothetical protein [Nostocales cyanobacterium LEGE 12452]
MTGSLAYLDAIRVKRFLNPRNSCYKCQKMVLSARASDRILKVVRTIAD